MFEIMPTTCLRRSPYFQATVEAGVTGFTPYNQMLLPLSYGDPEAEYRRLLEGVAQWDVAAQRQVQLTGPDAGRLAQLLTARDLSRCAVGQGKYVPLCNHAGSLINDPVLLKLADDRYWLSIADSNILFWSRAIAAERGLGVAITEPDVSPLAVQGPKAVELAAALFGDWVRALKFFWFRQTELEGIPLVLARSGWSKQGGFELYLMDGSRGTALWNLVAEAGRPWDIGPGTPNACERIEGGLLSWGGDTDDATNPFEVRLDAYVDLNLPDEVIGMAALKRIHAEGPRRHQLGVVLDGAEPAPPHVVWHEIRAGGRSIGHMTNGVWSYRLKRTIGYALVSRAAAPGDAVEVLRDGVPVPGALVALPFI